MDYLFNYLFEKLFTNQNILPVTVCNNYERCKDYDMNNINCLKTNIVNHKNFINNTIITPFITIQQSYDYINFDENFVDIYSVHTYDIV